jgi:hypothetical protein
MLGVRWRHKDPSKRRSADPTTRLHIPEDPLLWERHILHKLLITVLCMYIQSGAKTLGNGGYMLNSECQVSFAPLCVYVICALFYGFLVSRTIHLVLNGGIDRERRVRNLEGYDRGLIIAPPSRNSGPREKHVNYNQHRCSGRVSNREPSECRSGVQFLGGVAVVSNCFP